jgi:two-component system, OmpR family, KDP operon response regulator KdpE
MMTNDNSKILIVDDERQIVRTLQTALASHGYEIRGAANGLDGLILFREWNPNLVITDLSMPEMSGVELCREVRRVSNTPIIVLSVRSQEAMKVAALDAGADDYVTKPFGIQELLARVRAQLRRISKSDTEPTVIRAGDFEIDAEKHRALVRGKEVHLTPKEFDLLLYFMRHPGQVLSHKLLLKTIWGPSGENQPEYLRVLVAQLRKKIESSQKPGYIQSEPWVGYRFEPQG